MMKLTIVIVTLVLVAHTCCAFQWQHQERCREQLQKVNLKPCEKHVMEKIQGGEERDDDEDVLTTVRGRVKYIRKQKHEDEEEEGHVEKCCREITQLNSPKCQCKALKKIMERQSEKLEDMDQKLQMVKELMNLATTCRLAPMISMSCDLSLMLTKYIQI
ncbi:hypothetical protein VNO78_13761 [Psophocarpus tetragonolobus]|uniref:Bifunctional inhibitor/plant lipid transfer protein/seed storage helical domain-containing protein n=1 Tax=Psophocarpus tetragonolobus TaxID=3891 RepID=A0AAN9XQ16_PSOTE